MRRSASIYSAFFTGTCLLLFSCSSPGEKSDAPALVTPAEQQAVPAATYDVKTFEVNDAAGKKAGWGYDIYMDGSRMIHQPTVQAVQGIRYFRSEEEARKVGTYAMNKMKDSGNFPTISIEELDSLGVTK